MAVDLDQLSDYLDGERNEYGLDFAATHGFLCAVAVGPNLPNWQKLLFDGHDKEVPPAILQLINDWLANIRQTLDNEDTIEFPFEIEEADVDSSLGDWSVGFVDAMFLNEDAWFIDDIEDALIELTLPMMVFSGIDEEDPQMESFRRNGQLMDDMAQEIPENLSDIYLLYHAPQ